MAKIAIIGGGPAGYEAALTASALGAEVTLVADAPVGGSAVLTDVVPSKGLISVAEVLTRTRHASELGIELASVPRVDLARVNRRLLDLAANQSNDIADKLTRAGVNVIAGHGRIDTDGQAWVADQPLPADAVLLATGAKPRQLETAIVDGKRILDWKTIYELAELPSRLIVVGSGVTGAEFASAFNALGSNVVLVSSRAHVLPSEDSDASAVIERVFAREGIELVLGARAVAAIANETGVSVELSDGFLLEGSHVLLAVGAVPNTDNLGLVEAGVQKDDRGFIVVDRVSRTSMTGIYAAGDCTGGMMLASSAAMQGRIAMHHALGSAVVPFDRAVVAANVFTDPEIATVGVSQSNVDNGEFEAEVIQLPLATNARAKMQGRTDGFVKVFCQPTTRTVLGGVVVAPNASEIIYSLALAVTNRLTVSQLAETFTVYPSLSGSLAEAARQLVRK